jgi:pimeloyl-ACP methyl ester carboxylesterase
MSIARIQVILLPGLHGSGALFTPFIAAAPAWALPVAVSYPNTMPADYEQLAQYARQFIDFNRPFLLIGESFSGPAALHIAAAQPEQLRGVVLSASFVTNPRPLLSLLISGQRAMKLLSLPLPPGVLQWLLLGSNADANLLKQTANAIAAAGPAVLAARLDLIVRSDLRAMLSRCLAPVLYFRATHDRLVAEKSAREVARIHPGTKIAAFPSGHFVLQTSPQQCWREIETFLDAIETRGLENQPIYMTELLNI